jgi:hypothetical protein
VEHLQQALDLNPALPKARKLLEDALREDRGSR